MIKILKKQAQKWTFFLSILFLLTTVCYYNVLFDIVLIGTIFIVGYGVGHNININIKGNPFEKMVLQTAFGVGIIGLLIYFVLLLGIGNKSVYIAILLILLLLSIPPICRKREEMQITIAHGRQLLERHMIMCAALVLTFSVYIAYASAPMSMYDTMTKHLPITLYAAENGSWYTNVTESIVYGESMVLQYTYSTLFASLGAFKALTLFNVVLFFLVYIILCYFVRRIFHNTNLWLLGIIFFTTPFFFHFSTIFYLEILPLFFLFSAFVGMSNTTGKKVWDNIVLIAFLSGCSLFVKLTHIFTLGVMVSVLAIYCIYYAWKTKKVKQGFLKLGMCIVAGALPSVTSILHIWYRTGNPLFPSYNGLFQSPYFSPYNFKDPYTNKLSFSITSLLDIVFHTTNNIEMHEGAMGLFLLFVFVIPIAAAILIYKKQCQNYMIWTAVTAISYGLNTITTYNLRYFFAVWLLAGCTITIGLSVCIDVLRARWVRMAVACALGGILLAPNLKYIWQNLQPQLKMQKNEASVKNKYATILDELPDNKTVLSFTNSNQFKGQYSGYYASTTWHNSTIDLINEGEYSWEEYISSFDYVLIDKLCEEIDMAQKYGFDVSNDLQPMLGEVCAENDYCIVYQVIPQRTEMLHKKYNNLQECSVLNPIFEIIPERKESYYITNELVNDSEESITMRFQINWMSEEQGFIDTSIITYEAEPGEHIYSSDAITVNPAADYGILYICTADERVIKVKSYDLKGANHVIEKESNMYKERTRLKNLGGEGDLYNDK